MTPADFTAKWRDNKLSERAGAQAHFLDLCEVLGVEKPSDPDNYCFERGAKRTGAGRGWADVWMRHNFAWEYKAPNANLETALKQLMTYALALDNPPLLVVSDRLRIEIHTHFTGTPSELHTIALADIGTPENLQKLRWLFTDPEKFKPQRTRAAITLQAAKLIGDLAWQLQQRGHDPHQVAHFLNKIIFCLFAEDAKGPASEPLLPNQIFSTVLKNGRTDISRFERQLKNLFKAMSDRHGEFGEHVIQWFNGGLFDDDLTLPLTSDDIDKLINVSLLDWSAIEPSIFGTLFERGLDPAKRSQLGAHYTDPVSIMRIVNPVIVEPLLSEWQIEKESIAASMAVFHEFENSKKSAEKAKATKALKDATARYITFKEKLKAFKVLDPACGSGNFLYLALQALKDIELRVGLEAEELGLERGFPEVGPQSMYGIEISPYAAELAKVTVWIGDIQWMLKHGFAPSKEPILKTLDQIECRDALVNNVTTNTVVNGQPTKHEQITHAQWPAVDVIIGNPPFLGDKKMRAELGDAYTEDLRELYKHWVPGGADLVCYWFANAQHAIETGGSKRAGLVGTNSIRQSTNRPVLERIATNGEIHNAWSDEEWVNEGAAVRVSIVAFAKSHPSKLLNGISVAGIYADLTSADSGIDLGKALTLDANTKVAFQGPVKVGSFDIPGQLAREWLAAPNPHGRSNADVLHPWANGQDLTKRASDTWIIDFGSDAGVTEAALYQLPFEYAKASIKPQRDAQNDVSRKQKWWLHGRSGADMRSALQPLYRYIATSRVAKHRFFVWLPVAVFPDSRLYAIARDDDTSFGVLQSRIHELWSLANASMHGVGNDPTYNAKSCFENFPFPKGLTPNIKPEQYTNPHAADIATAAKRLNELREAWLNPAEWVGVIPEVVAGYPDRIIPKPEFAKAIKERTLTNLYNARQKGEVQWLEDAHRTLDAAVAKAYGWDDYTPEMPDEEILRRLLALNLERSKAPL
ncbi:MAG: class I SAM-dependent DNA methyltransferase [Rhodocyclaceae bacterium]|nr:class I SAM-dependent DNA methyltransferase [Rhodocyclaceae bacterium]MCA3023413.1 class I SAM-dependent DNA methyltransferase [Rhodocyclaceae bacterium]MCA3053458.1 class I SAM-dependent DNA methyltransferase [Rhodocyclaceae bacterium]MCA3057259.1 class I SAM-dependent DNA methyltransferase [Rhodocyclaceae bacterium]